VTELRVEATEDARGYLEEIASEMVLLFPITMDEAIGRINRHFAGRQFLTPLAVNMLMHEEQDAWAKHVTTAEKHSGGWARTAPNPSRMTVDPGRRLSGSHRFVVV
jgi:hypothetical protein